MLIHAFRCFKIVFNSDWGAFGVLIGSWGSTFLRVFFEFLSSETLFEPSSLERTFLEQIFLSALSPPRTKFLHVPRHVPHPTKFLQCAPPCAPSQQISKRNTFLKHCLRNERKNRWASNILQVYNTSTTVLLHIGGSVRDRDGHEAVWNKVLFIYWAGGDSRREARSDDFGAGRGQNNENVDGNLHQLPDQFERIHTGSTTCGAEGES